MYTRSEDKAPQLDGCGSFRSAGNPLLKLAEILRVGTTLLNTDAVEINGNDELVKFKDSENRWHWIIVFSGQLADSMMLAFVNMEIGVVHCDILVHCPTVAASGKANTVLALVTTTAGG